MIHFVTEVNMTLDNMKHNERSLMERVIPTGLKLKKRSAFQLVLEDFDLNWNEVLSDAEEKLVILLLEESKRVITKIGTDITNEIRKN